MKSSNKSMTMSTERSQQLETMQRKGGASFHEYDTATTTICAYPRTLHALNKSA